MQNIVVIGRVYFTLECFEFSSNFEFDRNMLSGTGARCGILYHLPGDNVVIGLPITSRACPICENAIIGQNRAGIGLMLPASGRYQPGSGTLQLATKLDAAKGYCDTVRSSGHCYNLHNMHSRVDQKVMRLRVSGTTYPFHNGD